MGGFKDIFNKFLSGKEEKPEKIYLPEASSYNHFWSISYYDGEKNPGEMGIPKQYLIDYPSLRKRSYESFLKSDITQMIIKKHITWIIGAGLKLQLAPAKLVLKNFGYEIKDDQDYIRLIEEAFGLYSRSRESSLSNNSNLNFLSREALKDAIVGGDVLVRFRVIGKSTKFEIIDGDHVRNPTFESGFPSEAIDRGNIIQDGIELNPETKEHIAYFVKQTDGSFKRLLAKGPRTGRLLATLFCGFKFRIDDQRGLPLLAAVLQSLKMLDRYKEATVAAAEERAKIPFTIEHGSKSDGTNPMLNKLKNATGNKVVELSSFDEGEKVARKFLKTTQKTAINLPPDSKMAKLSDDADINFADFFSSNIDLVAATMETPPAVATSKYDGSYSSSRASLKDWEHVVKVKREDVTFHIHKPFFETWYRQIIMNGDIDSPGYLRAVLDKNRFIQEAYTNCRFIGPNIPHIDPLKEAKAERSKLGKLADNVPLTTVEKATENLNEGDYWDNVDKFQKEIEPFQEEESEEPETE